MIQKKAPIVFSPEELAAEEWRGVVGWEGAYQVSDLGRVRSLDRYDKRGVWRKGRILKPGVNVKSGYFYVNLCGIDRPPSQNVHDLVLRAFVGSPPEGYECCHGDGVRQNNRLKNLRWGTHHDNVQDAIRHGTMGISAETIERLVALRKSGLTLQQVAIECGVAEGTVLRLERRHNGGASMWPNAKLTKAQRLEVADLIRAGVGYREIGRRYGISHSSVKKIERNPAGVRA